MENLSPWIVCRYGESGPMDALSHVVFLPVDQPSDIDHPSGGWSDGSFSRISDQVGRLIKADG